jgi:hypothetical protein
MEEVKIEFRKYLMEVERGVDGLSPQEKNDSNIQGN